MKQKSAPNRYNGLRLTRPDLIRYEHALKDALQTFLGFKSYSLYFPPSVSGSTRDAFGEEMNQPVYLPSERKLLLPLALDGELLGMFVAKGARVPAPKTTLPLLTKAATLCLENLLLAKAAQADPVTGLHNPHSLLSALEREISLVQECILPGSASCLESGPEPSSGFFGLLLFDMDYFSWVNQDYGFLFGEATLHRVGEIIKGLIPGDGLAARLSEDVFAVMLPGASAKRCQDLADTIRAALVEEIFEYPVNGERLKISASAGFARYPQDLHGGQLAAPPGEQARILVHKAKKTLTCAKDLGRDQVMSFGRLLREGGQVLETLPLGRVAVSLGRSVDAKEGQRFLVWSPRFERAAQIKRGGDQRLTGRYPAMVKGEIILMEVQEDMSFAEVLHLTDSSWPMEPADRLLLAQEPEDRFNHALDPKAPPQRDMASGLMNHRDFIRHLTQAREGQAVFTLAIIRLPESAKDRSPAGASPSEARVQEVTALCREYFGQDMQGGRYSTGSLLLFVPGFDPLQLRPRFAELCAEAKNRLELILSVGLAGYPFLNFAKPDVLENCRKALDHSLLITVEPRLAVFDSISLTISADRLFTLGDVYAAIEDYKLALLADENNILARNSLGICLARLGRMPQAKAEFERVLSQDSKNLMALYNHGYACQRLGEDALARKAFQRCLKINPEDVYSLLRLGRMAEESGKLAMAKKYYLKAAGMPAGRGLTMRHLARLALTRNAIEEAREYLHQALLHDPKDAFSMNILAKLYLDGGEDPAIAEALARQSAALRPDQKSFWKELARALEAMGKKEEAQQALSRSM